MAFGFPAGRGGGFGFGGGGARADSDSVRARAVALVCDGDGHEDLVERGNRTPARGLPPGLGGDGRLVDLLGGPVQDAELSQPSPSPTGGRRTGRGKGDAEWMATGGADGRAHPGGLLGYDRLGALARGFRD